jgi:hypothetical protein
VALGSLGPRHGGRPAQHVCVTPHEPVAAIDMADLPSQRVNCDLIDFRKANGYLHAFHQAQQTCCIAARYKLTSEPRSQLVQQVPGLAR